MTMTILIVRRGVIIVCYGVMCVFCVFCVWCNIPEVVWAYMWCNYDKILWNGVGIHVV